MYPTAILSRLLLFFAVDVVLTVVGLTSSVESAGHFVVGECSLEISSKSKTETQFYDVERVKK